MKKELFIARPSGLYSTALLTSMLVFCGIVDARANTGTGDNLNVARIHYVGSTNSLLTFNVSYHNDAAEKLVLEITDDQGDVLYKDAFTATAFDKNIYLKNLGDKCRVHFSLKAGKQTITQTFDIFSQTKLIQENVVSKI